MHHRFEVVRKYRKECDVEMYNYNNVEKEFKIPTEVKDKFKITYRKGIYKELHKRKLLTDEQLDVLLNKSY